MPPTVWNGADCRPNQRRSSSGPASYGRSSPSTAAAGLLSARGPMFWDPAISESQSVQTGEVAGGWITIWPGKITEKEREKERMVVREEREEEGKKNELATWIVGSGGFLIF